MKIKTIPVKVFKTILTCSDEKCSGNYEFAGQVNVSNSGIEGVAGIAIYLHRCTVCGDEQNFEKKFPQLSYEDLI